MHIPRFFLSLAARGVNRKTNDHLRAYVLPQASTAVPAVIANAYHPKRYLITMGRQVSLHLQHVITRGPASPHRQAWPEDFSPVGLPLFITSLLGMTAKGNVSKNSACPVIDVCLIEITTLN